MKISDVESARASQINGVSQAQAISASTATQAGTNGTSSSSPAARVELSEQAQTVATARDAVNAAPDTRDDLVARIKSQVDSGTYFVSSTDIAEQMVRRAQADSIR